MLFEEISIIPRLESNTITIEGIALPINLKPLIF